MSALISRDGLYRYNLTRKTGKLYKAVCLFDMLNPSTADAELDDPTIRRCIGFAKKFNCQRLIVTNRFAFRATKPADLYAAADPIGPENDKQVRIALREVSMSNGIVIAGWGAHDVRGRDAILRSECARLELPLYCLGKTANGSPRHPLYVRGEKELELL